MGGGCNRHWGQVELMKTTQDVSCGVNAVSCFVE